MREIKFRIWLYGRFCYWGFIDDGHGLCFAGLPTSNKEPLTLEAVRERSQQFTGLKDKSGKEIYEGDIVRASRRGYGGEMSDSEVRWGKYSDDEYVNGVECWVCGSADEPAPLSEAGTPDTYGHSAFVVEVIGNIYENPDLLERK